VVLSRDRHTASAARNDCRVRAERQSGQYHREKTAGKLLSATSLKVGGGFRLALPTGPTTHGKAQYLKERPIEPDELVDLLGGSHYHNTDSHFIATNLSAISKNRASQLITGQRLSSSQHQRSLLDTEDSIGFTLDPDCPPECSLSDSAVWHQSRDGPDPARLQLLVRTVVMSCMVPIVS